MSGGKGLKKIFTLLGAGLFVFWAFGSGPAEAQVKVQWFGHSCFQIVTPAGVKILADPFSPDMGYAMPSVSPDIVLVSHEHYDHNFVKMAKGSPKVLRGLNPETKDWNKIDFTLKDVHIRSINAWHFEKEADASRGKNAIMVMEMPGMRLVHLGDLGRPLNPEQIALLGKVDVLFLPVGGVYTIDAEAANKVLEQLKPSIVFPMHYKTPALKLELNQLEPFLAGKTNVRKISGNSFTISRLPEQQEIIVLDYK